MRNPRREQIFKFKQFTVKNHLSAMKVGTDGVLLGAWALHQATVMNQFTGKELNILDVGSGTGVIALMAAQVFSDAQITAIEIDAGAVQEAEYNFKESAWHERLRIVHGDFNKFQSEKLYDLIISNPPFFINGIKAPDERRSDARHAGSLSPSTLIGIGSPFLSSGGLLCFISLPESRKEIETEAALSQLTLIHLTEVYTVEGKTPSRLLWCFMKPSPGISDPYIKDKLVLRNKEGIPTEIYYNLVSPFYLTVK